MGERHRRRVIAAGIAPSCDNYDKLPDLPRLAWSPENLPEAEVDGRRLPVCPLAKYWLESGDADLGRLYCAVDQAKYAAFDPECECRHLQNVLAGDDCCRPVAKKRLQWVAGGPLSLCW
ncbi:MAG: L-2-amino-thiazoline-4-carboxylic acid hydrolase [Chloroflexi bacterium]|nr:L-2-amino-thiazoline-4-carboxylic acid hydrolase [Actinomycetota bacterium]MCL5108230.1 L-2-amino-thiazoline-4-carboxylic acid hydrolase [Chloroflexota bacterium]